MNSLFFLIQIVLGFHWRLKGLLVRGKQRKCLLPWEGSCFCENVNSSQLTAQNFPGHPSKFTNFYSQDRQILFVIGQEAHSRKTSKLPSASRLHFLFIKTLGNLNTCEQMCSHKLFFFFFRSNMNGSFLVDRLVLKNWV